MTTEKTKPLVEFKLGESARWSMAAPHLQHTYRYVDVKVNEKNEGAEEQTLELPEPVAKLLCLAMATVQEQELPPLYSPIRGNITLAELKDDIEAFKRKRKHYDDLAFTAETVEMLIERIEDLQRIRQAIA